MSNNIVGKFEVNRFSRFGETDHMWNFQDLEHF